MAKTQYRLFFAVELSPQVKTQLLGLQHRYSDLDARPVPAENFHITLNFLGSVNEKKLELILDHFTDLSLNPFQIKAGPLIYWPKPKILAQSIVDTQQQLLLCKKTIDSQLAQIDFFQKEKQTFEPHVTLFRGVEQPPAEFLDCHWQLEVNAVSLMASNNNRNGVFYQTVESWSIQDPDIKRRLTGSPF